MQVYVQKSMSTTWPRRPSIVSGLAAQPLCDARELRRCTADLTARVAGQGIRRRPRSGRRWRCGGRRSIRDRGGLGRGGIGRHRSGLGRGATRRRAVGRHHRYGGHRSLLHRGGLGRGATLRRAVGRHRCCGRRRSLLHCGGLGRGAIRRRAVGRHRCCVLRRSLRGIVGTAARCRRRPDEKQDTEQNHQGLPHRFFNLPRQRAASYALHSTTTILLPLII